MKQVALFFALALALSGSAQAQSNEELKSLLDQALKTIQDLQNRVKALEQQKQAAPTTPAPAAAQAPAPEQPAAPPVAGERAPVVARTAWPRKARRIRTKRGWRSPARSSSIHLRLQADESGVERHRAAVADPGHLSGRSLVAARMARPSSACGRARLPSRATSRPRLGEIKTT